MSLYKRKDSSVWWVKLHHGGKIVQRSSGTQVKQQAQEFHDRLKAQLWEQSKLGVKPVHSWQEAVVRWLAETKHKRSHAGDVSMLKWLHPYLGHLDLNSITVSVIDEIRQARLRVASKSTCNRYLSLVRTVLFMALDEWQWVDKVPSIKMFKEPASRTRFLTVGQVQTLLQELPVHLRDMVTFSLQTGLRQSNVARLEWSQVDVVNAHMWVDASNSKNGKALSIPLNVGALEVLYRQVGKHPARVFTYFGKPLNKPNSKAFRSALKRAGIEDFRWHDLRHTWASWHVQNGTRTNELQMLGGWSSGKMVERYAHLSSEHLASAASHLDSLSISYDSATVKGKEGASNTL